PPGSVDAKVVEPPTSALKAPRPASDVAVAAENVQLPVPTGSRIDADSCSVPPSRMVPEMPPDTARLVPLAATCTNRFSVVRSRMPGSGDHNGPGAFGALPSDIVSD